MAKKRRKTAKTAPKSRKASKKKTSKKKTAKRSAKRSAKHDGEARGTAAESGTRRRAASHCTASRAGCRTAAARIARRQHGADAPARRRAVTLVTFAVASQKGQRAKSAGMRGTFTQLGSLPFALCSLLFTLLQRSSPQHGRPILIERGSQQQAQHLAIAPYSRFDSVGLQKSIVQRVAGTAGDRNGVPPNAIGNGAEVGARSLVEPPHHLVAFRSRQRSDDRSIQRKPAAVLHGRRARACTRAIRRNSLLIRRRSRRGDSTRARPSPRARTAAASRWRASREKTALSCRQSTHA